MSERVTPTARGWWWQGVPRGDSEPWIVEVEESNDGELYLARSGWPVCDDGSWITRVLSPAVCEAVASVSKALEDPEADYAYLEAIESLREAILAELEEGRRA